MIEIKIPQEDVNSESAILVEWNAPNKSKVSKGQIIFSAETSKAIFEIEAEAEGYIVYNIQEGEEVEFNVPIAYIAESENEIDLALSKLAQEREREEPDVKITRKARQLALQYGVDFKQIDKRGIITEEDVRQLIELDAPLSIVITKAGELPKGVQRVLMLGGGLGGMQVVDILLNDPRLTVIGCLDDDESIKGKRLFGVEVIGKIGLLEDLWEKGEFDSAIITISTNINVRKNFFLKCKELGIPLVNAIDPTVRMNRGVVLGEGNVICAHVHIGVATVIGDNNFISSNCSIEHHNLWGSHNTTGPNCVTSSRVKVGDEVKFGTGIFIQPGISIGSNCQIASGSIITKNIPDNHAVKTKVQVTEVVKIEKG